MESTTGVASSYTTVHEDDGSTFNRLPAAITVIYALIGVTGILGNGLVIFVLVRQTMGRHVTNIFIVNQCAIDLFTSVMLLACYLPPEIDLAESTRSQGLARFICIFWLSKYPFWGAVMASTGNLMCLTLERYMAVLQPIRYQKLFRLPRTLWFAVLPWVVGYVYQSYWLTLQYVDEESGHCLHGHPGDVTQKAIGVVVFVVQYVLPLSFMAFVYSKIVKTLRTRVGSSNSGQHQAEPSVSSTVAHLTLSRQVTKDTKQNAVVTEPKSPVVTQAGPSAAPPGPQRSNTQNVRSRVRKNVIRTFFLVCLAFLICWTPNQLCYLYYNLGGDIDYESPVFFATISLAFCNMVVNPFIYSVGYHQFRAGFRKTFACLGLPEIVSHSGSGSVNARTP